MHFDCVLQDQNWKAVFQVLKRGSMAAELEEAVKSLPSECINALEALLDQVEETYGYLEPIAVSFKKNGKAKLEFECGYWERYYAPLVAKWLITGGAKELMYNGLDIRNFDDDFWNPPPIEE